MVHKQMASFTAFILTGLFPNPGQNIYFITPPFFQSLSYTHPQTRKVATIRNVNFNGGKNVYIQSATLDGRAWTNNWISHEFFTEGGILELTLGDSESKWGTSEEDGPGSLSGKGFGAMEFVRWKREEGEGEGRGVGGVCECLLGEGEGSRRDETTLSPTESNNWNEVIVNLQYIVNIDRRF